MPVSPRMEARSHWGPLCQHCSSLNGTTLLVTDHVTLGDLFLCEGGSQCPVHSTTTPRVSDHNMAKECLGCARHFSPLPSLPHIPGYEGACRKFGVEEFNRDIDRAEPGLAIRAKCCLCVQRMGYPASACGPCRKRGAFAKPIAEYEPKGMLNSKCKHCGRKQAEHFKCDYMTGRDQKFRRMCAIPREPAYEANDEVHRCLEGQTRGARKAAAPAYAPFPALSSEQVRAKMAAEKRAWMEACSSAEEAREQHARNERERWDNAREEQAQRDPFQSPDIDYTPIIPAYLQPYGGDVSACADF